MKRALWFAFLIVEMGCTVTALGDGGALQRWGLVCSPELEKAPISDLLAIELSKATGLELVNRDALSTIASELELTLLFDAAHAERRLKVGKMLRADALVLVRRNENHPKAPLLVTIAECNQGARLHSQEVFAESEASAASKVASIVLATRRRFPHGVTQLLGVPDFLSRNLTHEYDPFQGRYASLLRAAISANEGVAVLEIEEARSIGKELAGGELGVRRVPIIVEGEFRMDGPSGSTPPTVGLRIRLVSDKSSQTIESPKLEIAKVPQWIASDLASQVLSQAGDNRPLTTDTQIRLLVVRADEFAQLGNYRQAIRLREAVLLLQPSLQKQRLKLLNECMTVIGRDLLVTDGRQLDRSAIQERCAHAVDLHLEAMEHLEYLIRNRETDRSNAVELTSRLSQAFHRVDFSVIQLEERHGDDFGRGELARAQQPTRRFFLDTVPRILEMPAPPGRPQDAFTDQDLLDRWQRVLLEGVAHRTDQNYLTLSDLADLVRVYTRVLPDGLPLPSLGLPRPYYLGPGGATPKDYSAFYQELAASSHASAAIRGRFMLLQCQLDRARGRPRSGSGMLVPNPLEKTRFTPEKARPLLDQVQKLIADYKALPRSANLPSAERDRAWHDLIRLKHSIQEAIPPQSPSQLAESPKAKRTTGAVRFEPVTLVIEHLDGAIETCPQAKSSPATTQRVRSMDAVRCGQTTDVFWHSAGLYVMRQPGSIKEILHADISDRSEEIRQVVWDGRHLWVAKAGAVWIVALDGAVQARIDASFGLPPAAQGVVLHPLESGRVVALGSFGTPPRSWAATLVFADGKAAVRIFFEAKLAPPPGPHMGADDSMDIGFNIGPGSVHAYQPKGASGRPLLLVRRASAHPLQINLETLSVSVSPLYGEKRPPSEAWWYSRDGVLLGGNGSQADIRAPQGQPWSDGKSWRLIPLSNPPAPNLNYDDTKNEELVSHLFDNSTHPTIIDAGDGYLYYFGKFCYRIKPATWTADRLTSTWMPWPYDDCRGFGVSNHYGITAWAAGTLYRITINEAALPPTGGPISK